MAVTDTDEQKRAQAGVTLVGAAVTSAIGVAIAGTASRTVGGVVMLLGWLALVYALHAFGRAGD
jgi:hypothetical protein